MLTKGTSVFFQHPETGEIVRLKRCTAFNPGGSPRSQVETTDLEELDAMQYEAGLAQPGQGTMAINADPGEESHRLLQELAEGSATPTMNWYVGFSDGTPDIAPTITGSGASAEVSLPTTRTFYHCRAYVADFPFDFQLNANVTVSGSLQRSGRGTWHYKNGSNGSGGGEE